MKIRIFAGHLQTNALRVSARKNPVNVNYRLIQACGCGERLPIGVGIPRQQPMHNLVSEIQSCFLKSPVPVKSFVF
jgi:hypothetical protein